MQSHRFMSLLVPLILPLMALLPAAQATAQLPLNIAELLVEQSVVKLEIGTAFRHGDEYFASAGSEPGVAPPGLFLKRAYEVTDFSSSLRYGAGRALEINATARASRLRWRRQDALVANESRQSLDIGMNWLALAEGRAPAVLLQLGGQLLESSSRSGAETRYGGVGRIAATAYRSLDPVVLSLAMGYEWRRARERGGNRVDPGDVAWLAPQVNFAVNPEVTLIAGMGLFVAGSDRLSGRALSERSALTSLRLGLGFAPDSRSSIFFATDFAASGAHYAHLALDWIYRF